MNSGFFNKFDDPTRIKLALFQGYIREWLSVFMTQKKYKRINLFDFFSGPGRDASGIQGSPLIIVNEIKNYCITQKDRKSQDLEIRMLFNDKSQEHISQLQRNVDEIACSKGCCKIEYSNHHFDEALKTYMREIRDVDTANLIIMDQFGVKEVTPELIHVFSKCDATDILFFISSGFIRRFINTPEIRNKYKINPKEMKDIDYKAIHRYICQYYREQLKSTQYYLSPFSIKKKTNIYGIVFGSKHPYGLEKFLNVCWSLDEHTGEANYNIDYDMAWGGQLSLFNEQPRKIDLFKKELKKYIEERSPDNLKMYIFCIEKGFSMKKAGEILREMQNEEGLSVIDLTKQKNARKGAYYLGWEHYKTKEARVRFTIEDKQ